MRADSAFYAANAVGRCTIELPYVSNPHGRQARRLLARTSAAGSAGTGGAGKKKRAFGNNVTFATSIVTAGPVGSSSSSGGGGTSNGEGVGIGSVHGGRRPWLLVFTGSLDVCCEPGKSIRHAMRKLVDASPNDTSVRHVGTAAGHGLPGNTPAEQKEIYRTAGVQLASSRFCLVPAGDNEVSSRLYSAMAAGCVPVVVANQLSGAFASRVPYSRFWVRVEQQTFIHNPLGLLSRLRAMAPAEVAERRARMLRHVADVTYDQQLSAAALGAGAVGAAEPLMRVGAAANASVLNEHRPAPSPSKSHLGDSKSHLGDSKSHLGDLILAERLLTLARGTRRAVAPAEYASRRASILNQLVRARQLGEASAPAPSAVLHLPPTASGRGASRLATNFLRAADEACLRGAETSLLGHYPSRHPYAADDKWGLNCSCLIAPPKFFWCAGHHCTGPTLRTKLWVRGHVPTDTCRCLHCATLCPTEDEIASKQANKQVRKLRPGARG